MLTFDSRLETTAQAFSSEPIDMNIRPCFMILLPTKSLTNIRKENNPISGNKKRKKEKGKTQPCSRNVFFFMSLSGVNRNSSRGRICKWRCLGLR